MVETHPDVLEDERLTPVWLFIVLYLLTGGCYLFYWFFLRWKELSRRAPYPISPLWRSVFNFFFIMTFQQKMVEWAEEKGLQRDFSPALFGFCYYTLYILALAPSPFNLFSIFSIIPLLPAFRCQQFILKTTSVPLKHRFFPNKIEIMLVCSYWTVSILAYLFIKISD